MAHSTVSRLLPQSAAQVLLTVVFLLIGYQVTIYIYNIFLHPLRKFPGPLTSAASNWPKIRASTRGDGVFRVVDLHHKYGEVVRTVPNELSFSGNAAYRDIYGHKKAGQRTLDKDPKFYGNPSGDYDIVNGNDEQHARMRRVFTHAFSDKALKRQEPLFLLYVDKLVAKFKELSAKEPERKFNMVQMYNFTTFDIMGDLTFGESLNMLEDTDYHPWVAAMLPAFRFAVYVHVIRCFPLLESFMLKYCIPKSTIETMETHKKFCVDRVDRRLKQKDTRPDIWGMIMETEGSVDAGLTKQEQYSNANLFMIAGTETTATILSGITYYLLTNPSKMSRLIEEIRSKIRNEDEIGIERLQSLPYLNAVIEEGLRMYPSISYGLARKTPPGAPTFIDGREVPAGYQVYVTNLAAQRNPNNYRDPYEFVPERWLTGANATELSERYAEDKRLTFTPFSMGPRGCMGKNMAYHETRLILTKVLFHFDLELCEESQKWNDHKIFIMWDKPPLYCHVRPRHSST